MGDLDIDTRLLATGPGSFAVELSADWEVWGPNGGYLAAIAMRAAGVTMARARPVSISAHFVGAGTSRATDVVVTISRATKVATSAMVTLSQDGRVLLTAAVWGADNDLAGLEHQTDGGVAGMPAADGLPTVEERMAGVDNGPRYTFWDNFDHRPLHWIVDWENRSPSAAVTESWYRFVPTSTFADPWVDAARSLILIDVDGWPAAVLPHPRLTDYYAPTIELTARFVGPTGANPWLLSRAAAPAAAGGIIACTGEIWTPDGRLVAVGGSSLLCRDAARRPAP
ncbi:MAG TPA: thioesterase family protein [Ilumatobacteraceae bacterium]